VGEKYKHGEVIEHRKYGQTDFDRSLVLEKRTQLVAAGRVRRQPRQLVAGLTLLVSELTWQCLL